MLGAEVNQENLIIPQPARSGDIAGHSMKILTSTCGGVWQSAGRSLASHVCVGSPNDAAPYLTALHSTLPKERISGGHLADLVPPPGLLATAGSGVRQFAGHSHARHVQTCAPNEAAPYLTALHSFLPDIYIYIYVYISGVS